MNCPYCKSAYTEPHLRLSAQVMEWICCMCKLTWNVDDDDE